MSAQLYTVARPARPAASLETRLRATALSEWIKFRSVRSGPIALFATALSVVIGAWLLGAGYRNGWHTMSPDDKASFDPVFKTMQGIEMAQLFVGALGVMTMTGEYSSGLIRGTFVATPQRVQLVTVKALIFAVVSWAWCTLLSFAGFFLGQALLTSPAKHVAIGDPGVLRAVFGGGLYLMLVGVFGLFLGVVVRRTASALALLFGIVLVLPLAVSFLPGTISDHVAEYLPSNAGEQIWHLLPGDAHTVGHWPGLGVLTAYVVATAVAALVLVRRRDA